MYFAVLGCNGGLGVIIRLHLYKAESAAATGLMARHNKRLRHFAMLPDYLFKVIGCFIETEIASL